MAGHRTAALVGAAAATLAVALAPAASAVPGALDPSFSADGQTTTRFGQDVAVGAVAAQGRRILVAGTSVTPSGQDGAIVRYRADGSRDPSFGRNGRVRLDFGKRDSVGDLLVLPSGKILAVGSSQRRFLVVRLTPDGRLDRGFGGGDGIVRTGFGTGFASGTQILRVTRGRFVVAGTTGDQGGTRFALARYQPSGTLDRSFSRDGRVTTRFGPADTFSVVVTLLRWTDSSAVVAVGETVNGGSPKGVSTALASYTPRGRPDPLFGGGDGKTVESISPFDYVAGAVMQKNSFILVGGHSELGPTGWDATLLRFNASGHLDSGWGGGDGFVSHDVGSTLEYWLGIAGDRAGAVLVGQVDGDAAVMRVGASGALDSSFGAGGYAVTPFPGGDSELRAAVLDRRHRVLAAGTAPATLVADGFAVERLLAN
jgi:uncharacterized delta-60 repeat protein